MRGTGWWAGSAALLLAGCATAPRAPAVAPAPPPPAVQPEPAPLPPPPPPTGWEDKALTAGDWRYAQAPTPQADYGNGNEAAFTLRCDVSQRRVSLLRAGAPAGTALTLRTTYGVRQLPVGQGGAASLAASDPILDEIAFSRGRVAVEAPDVPTLTLPTWPEPARVIEECRP
ncbi:MAG TPA: hypothetical protein VGC56_08990 [Allosphingosinicella sp.]|jgi:hypothetical protein